MATEQAPASEASIQERMTALFSATPEVATEDEATPVEAQTDEQVPSEEPEQTEDSGLDELDVDGNVYKVPKELKAKVSEWKDGYERRADYTRKTQTLADLHRQTQIVAEAVEQRQKFEQEVSTERTELYKVQADIDRFKAIDWSSLDVDNYIKLRGQFDSLKEKASDLDKTINSKAQQFQEKLAENKQRLVQEGQKFLQKTIPGWGKDAAEAAISGAREIGYTDHELANAMDPRFVTLAWKAAQFDRIQGSKTSAVASAQKAPPIVKPGVISTGVIREKAYKEARAKLGKSGSLDDAAALLRLRRK
jgi:hypothetical protein